MVPYHRPKSGHITCYLNRTYHVLLTAREPLPCFHRNQYDSLPSELET